MPPTVAFGSSATSRSTSRSTAATTATHPELFLPLEEVVAGAPPDDLNALGQLWGNPLYDWTFAARSGYRWWIERMRRVLDLVDVFRLDHFRAFAAYWTVPAGAATARHGWWSPGPGEAPFRAAEAVLGPLPVIAEDLGLITPDVHVLRDGSASRAWRCCSGRSTAHPTARIGSRTTT